MLSTSASTSSPQHPPAVQRGSGVAGVREASVDETNIKFKVVGGALAAEMVKMERVGRRLGFA